MAILLRCWFLGTTDQRRQSSPDRGAFMVIFFAIVGAFAAIGGFWANAKGLSPILWAIVCGLIGPIGLLILAFQKSQATQ